MIFDCPCGPFSRVENEIVLKVWPVIFQNCDRFFLLVYMCSFLPAFSIKTRNPCILRLAFKLGEANGSVCFDHISWSRVNLIIRQGTPMF